MASQIKSRYKTQPSGNKKLYFLNIILSLFITFTDLYQVREEQVCICRDSLWVPNLEGAAKYCITSRTVGGATAFSTIQYVFSSSRSFCDHEFNLLCA